MNAFLLLFVIIVLLLVAELLSIAQLVQIAKMKGHDGAGVLWFIGICGTVIMVAIIVALLPDRGDRAPQPSEANALPEV